VGQLLLRPVEATDMAEISSIYAEQVLNGTASWEYAPPGIAEMTSRMQAIVASGYPYMVATLNGVLAGYSYASSYRARIGYRFVVEDSIYVRSDLRGRGIGRRLLQGLIDTCSAAGYKQMIAVIGDSANVGSIELHRACGFETVGVFKNIGYKFDRWLDSVQMQRSL
jgi:phosphinothricin acetyltransferase